MSRVNPTTLSNAVNTISRIISHLLTFLKRSLITHKYINSTIIMIFIACCFSIDTLNRTRNKLSLSMNPMIRWAAPKRLTLFVYTG